MGLVLSFYYAGPRDWTKVIRFGGKHLYPLSQSSVPSDVHSLSLTPPSSFSKGNLQQYSQHFHFYTENIALILYIIFILIYHLCDFFTFTPTEYSIHLSSQEFRKFRLVTHFVQHHIQINKHLKLFSLMFNAIVRPSKE